MAKTDWNLPFLLIAGLALGALVPLGLFPVWMIGGDTRGETEITTILHSAIIFSIAFGIVRKTNSLRVWIACLAVTLVLAVLSSSGPMILGVILVISGPLLAASPATYMISRFFGHRGKASQDK